MRGGRDHEFRGSCVFLLYNLLGCWRECLNVIRSSQQRNTGQEASVLLYLSCMLYERTYAHVSRSSYCPPLLSHRVLIDIYYQTESRSDDTLVCEVSVTWLISRRNPLPPCLAFTPFERREEEQGFSWLSLVLLLSAMCKVDCSM